MNMSRDFAWIIWWSMAIRELLHAALVAKRSAHVNRDVQFCAISSLDMLGICATMCAIRLRGSKQLCLR